MSTFQNPTVDAAEASEALRGLAHASRVFEDPADTYAVLGDLLAGVRSLRQVLDQLATAHLKHRVRAHDDAGDQTAGATDALAVAGRGTRPGGYGNGCLGADLLVSRPYSTGAGVAVGERRVLGRPGRRRGADDHRPRRR